MRSIRIGFNPAVFTVKMLIIAFLALCFADWLGALSAMPWLRMLGQATLTICLIADILVLWTSRRGRSSIKDFSTDEREELERILKDLEK